VSSLDAIEPILFDFDFLNHTRRNSKLILLEEIAETITVDQVNGNGPVPYRLFRCLTCKCAGGDEQPLVGAPLQRTSEITDIFGADAPFPALTLEIDLERYEVDTQHTDTVDSTVAGFATHFYLNEPGLT